MGALALGQMPIPVVDDQFGKKKKERWHKKKEKVLNFKLSLEYILGIISMYRKQLIILFPTKHKGTNNSDNYFNWLILNRI